MKGHKRPRPDRGPDAWELIVDAGRDPITRKRKQRSRTFHGTATGADTALAQLVTEVSLAESAGPNDGAEFLGCALHA